MFGGVFAPKDAPTGRWYSLNKPEPIRFITANICIYCGKNPCNILYCFKFLPCLS